MSKKRNILRVDDYVEIINPIFVKRVGYPLCIADMEQELIKEHGKEINEFLQKMGIIEQYEAFSERGSLIKSVSYMDGEFVPEKILHEMGRELLKKRHYGGPERTLHTEEVPEYKGKHCRIISRKVVKTGGYNGSCGGYSWDGEYDYESAYLSDEKTHVLFFLDVNPNYWKSKRSRGGWTESIGWIESINLKKLDEEQCDSITSMVPSRGELW